MRNVLSIDLESWIYYSDVAAGTRLGDSGSERKKDLDGGYIPKATGELLDLLDSHGQKATFFVLGELYDWYPDTIEEIAKRGHEIGYHTHKHPVLKSGKDLEAELEQSSGFLTKFHPAGFRAPRIYIPRDCFPVLSEHGFRYSSSTYGEHRIRNVDGVDEIPISLWRYWGKDNPRLKFPRPLSLGMLAQGLPIGGGLFVNTLGSRISKYIDNLNSREVPTPAVLMIHPWQLYRPHEIETLGFKLRNTFRSPMSLPYLRGILKQFEGLLRRHEFVSFNERYYA